MSQLPALKRKYQQQGVTLPEEIQELVFQYFGVYHDLSFCCYCHRLKELSVYRGWGVDYCKDCIKIPEVMMLVQRRTAYWAQQVNSDSD